jgi:hypothetical protein
MLCSGNTDRAAIGMYGNGKSDTDVANLNARVRTLFAALGTALQ